MSNAQSWAETFAPIAAKYREDVMQATWGHLAPMKNTSYKGVVLFTSTAYNSGRIVLIDSNFENLDDSPWFYDFLYEWLNKCPNIERGGIYQVNCTFRNYRMYGTPKLLHKLN